jgi:hypothetical protein
MNSIPLLVIWLRKRRTAEAKFQCIPEMAWQLPDWCTGFEVARRTIWLGVTHLKDVDHELTTTNMLIDILYSALPY